MHTISAAITPKSNANAWRGPLEKLVSINRKKTGPIKTRLSIIPRTMAEKMSSNIIEFPNVGITNIRLFENWLYGMIILPPL